MVHRGGDGDYRDLRDHGNKRTFVKGVPIGVEQGGFNRGSKKPVAPKKEPNLPWGGNPLLFSISLTTEKGGKC